MIPAGRNADIVHRQNGGFPSREGGFDSHYPLQGRTSALHGSRSLLNVYDSPERRAATSPAMAQTRRDHADVQPVLLSFPPGAGDLSGRLHQFSVDTASEQRFSGIAGWVMRSPEVSPSSLDAVIAPVICWQKRGTEKIWRLGKTSTPPIMEMWQSGNCVLQLPAGTAVCE